MSDPEAQTVALGRITKPQGLRGQLRVKVYNPESDLLWQHSTWLLEQGSSTRSVKGRKVRMASPDVAVVSINGVTSRDAADLLRGAEVSLPVSVLPEAGEGEWYVRDLIGLAVVSDADQPIGEVVDLIPYPSVDCLLIETAACRYEVPMVGPYLGRVELDRRRVVVGNLSDLDPIFKPRIDKPHLKKSTP